MSFSDIFKRNWYLVIFLLLTMPLFTGTQVFAQEFENYSFEAQVQYRGWLGEVHNNEVAGTTGEGLSLEAFEMNFPDNSICYQSYVAYEGWQAPVSNGQVSGTVGESRAIEAIRIQLEGEMAQNYDVYYRVHSAYIGWLDWAKDGETAGTTDLTAPIQAIQIRVVTKDTPFTEPQDTPYINGFTANQAKEIAYSVHIGYVGWQPPFGNGATAGTLGEGKRIEALTVSAPNIKDLDPDSSVSYAVHVQDIGWQDFVSEGQIAGTEGEGKAIQALKMQITGKASSYLDIYYRVHVQNLGWLDWACDGAPCGTEGLGLQVEALEICMLPKGTAPQGPSELPYISSDSLNQMKTISLQSSVENIGWMDPVSSGTYTGTTGQNLGIEAIAMNDPYLPSTLLYYNLLLPNVGWQGEKANGEVAGTVNENRQAEGIYIRLAGRAEQLFDVYYQSSISDYGWLGWAKNGEQSGSTNGGKKLEAVNVVLVLKGDPAPGSSENSFLELTPPTPPKKYQSITDIPNWDLICSIVQHEGGDTYEGALAVMSCVMNRCDSGQWGGTDPVSVLTAPGQFSSYLGGYYRQFLGRTSPVVQQAVLDCMNGERNHPYQSFRAYATRGSVCIGGNWFF